MQEIRSTEAYIQWFRNLRDIRARAKIADRVARLAAGDPGDSRSVGAGVVELRINFGPGYRVYYSQRGDILILLLCGGDKNSQSKDIERAKMLARQYGPGEE